MCSRCAARPLQRLLSIRRCPFDFSGMNPIAIASGAITMQGVGYESFTIDMSSVTANVWSIGMEAGVGMLD